MTEINNDIRIQKLQQKLDDVLLKIKINQSILMREMNAGLISKIRSDIRELELEKESIKTEILTLKNKTNG